uniref:Putative secreted protein n=1 Tax=Anopheles darlingi TaxID=43151 RepID=A0A2M4D399_ANODA
MFILAIPSLSLSLTLSFARSLTRCHLIPHPSLLFHGAVCAGWLAGWPLFQLASDFLCHADPHLTLSLGAWAPWPEMDSEPAHPPDPFPPPLARSVARCMY